MRRPEKNDAGKIVLPITPMLDLTFQLLFFFIVSFNPADLEGAVRMTLPAEKGGALPRKDNPLHEPPANEEPQFPTDLRVEVSSGPEGRISAISVSNLEGRQLPMDGFAGLTKHLRAVRADLGNKEAIKVGGDNGLTASGLMAAVDACRAAGFTDIVLMQPR